MLAFQISVNGQRVQTVASAEEGVLYVNLFCATHRDPQNVLATTSRLSARGHEANCLDTLSWPDIDIRPNDLITVQLLDCEIDAVAPRPDRVSKVPPPEIPVECPACGSRVARVFTSLRPINSEDALLDMLSGCAILGTTEMPAWVCLNCQPRWREVHESSLRIERFQRPKERAIEEQDFDKAKRILERQRDVKNVRETLIRRLMNR